ncbi:MAG: hypothetical protein EXQ56_06270 [Acidobacteria bacterium]|nr:hypothetical protein [Acidobacteriota bacterium]
MSTAITTISGSMMILFFAGALFAPPGQAQGFPDGPGKQIVQEACSVCHDTEVIATMRRTKAEWTETVQDMVSRGAPLLEGEREMVIEYLSKYFGPDKPLDKGAQNEEKAPKLNAANVSATMRRSAAK